MNEQLKVSIVVAVYNVECYIHRCIDSLLRQTYHNIEIILVDDGSTDGSPEICDQYAAKDGRVKVIHKANGGVSTARQVGLEASTGHYVIHADPDDFVDSDMVSSLLVVAETTDADMVTCDFFINDNVYQQKYQNSQDLLRQLVDVEAICVCWNTLVKREFILEHKISFTPNWLCMSEDFLFICRLLASGAEAVHLPKSFYHYWVSNSDSLTNNRSEKKLKSIMAVIDELGKILDADKYDNFYRRKRFAVLYAYQGKMFGRIKTIYPEIHSRMIKEDGDNMRQILGRFPFFAYYSSRVNFYFRKIFNLNNE